MYFLLRHHMGRLQTLDVLPCLLQNRAASSPGRLQASDSSHGWMAASAKCCTNPCSRRIASYCCSMNVESVTLVTSEIFQYFCPSSPSAESSPDAHDRYSCRSQQAYIYGAACAHAQLFGKPCQPMASPITRHVRYVRTYMIILWCTIQC